MEKKSVSLLLALTLVFSLLPAALAVESVTPTPPEWIKPEEYVVFENGKIYEPAYWESLLHCRDFESSGETKVPSDSPLRTDFNKIMRISNPETDPAAVYEYGLLRLMSHKNNGYPSEMEKNNFSDLLSEYGNSFGEDAAAKLELWSARYTFQHDYYGKREDEVVRSWDPDAVYKFMTKLETVMDRNGLDSVEQFLDCGTMDTTLGMEAYRWMSAYAGIELENHEHISIWLDGSRLLMDAEPEVKNERTMVPIRAVAEALGADVEWVQDTQQIVMTRAGVTVIMKLNSTTATIDGEPVEMDVAPYATEGRTLIPARYVAEFFGQNVDWNGNKKRVLISEDKSVAGNSNLEAWALPMGAMLSKIRSENLGTFGPEPRNSLEVKRCQETLNGSSWNIPDREDLAYTVLSMTLYGHDSSFREMAEDVKLRTEEERIAISEASDAWPFYMWEYTEYVDEKWGDRGIIAWDLFRMSNLVQWGYTAGYVTYAEALALLEPAATILCENFSSWDEAYENYLDGYNWWARNDVLGQDIWETSRGKTYLEMKADPKLSPIFDEALFETGVIGLPDDSNT